MAKLIQSQSAVPPSRKASNTGKLELSTAQFLSFSFTLLTLPLLLQTLYTIYFSPYFAPLHAPQNDSSTSINPSSPSLLTACRAHTYTTQIVSLDPLMIYINNFTSGAEAEALIKLGADDFEDSFISRSGGGNQKVSGRTSQSAPLAVEEPLVACIVDRARAFLGTMLHAHEPFSTPQLVRYFQTQRYDLHTDFWPRHQRLSDGSGRLFNRPASFFVFLRDNCTAGETWFPGVSIEDGKEVGLGGRVRRGRDDGDDGKGVTFKPVKGSAVFWVNIGEDGVGDRRVVHAGLPVGEGEKIGMNIWPRKFYAAQDD
ncbi:2OG-Fe(II)oxygenase family Oxidoreductase [Paraphaeosphaeria sporulosa]